MWVFDFFEFEKQGFRKVDPDRWEFANEWFLRGQFQLLRNIVRRKHSSNHCSSVKFGGDGDIGDEELVNEIARLRKEQRNLEEELEGMKKRLETTEKRPQQMMAFLHKVVEDPEILPRMMLRKDPTTRLQIGDKKRRLMISSSSSSPSTTTVTNSFDADEIEDDDSNPRDFGANFSSPEVSGPPPPPTMEGFISHVPWMMQERGVLGVVPMEISRSSSGGEMKYLTEMTVAATAAVEETHPPPPYPFSLFGCGF